MAFEAFVASGAAGRDRAQRLGLAVSVALHAPPIVLFALQLVVPPVLTERTEEVPPPASSPRVPVRIAGLWAPSRPRPPDRTALAAKEPRTPSPPADRGPAPAERPAPAPRPSSLALAEGGQVVLRPHPAQPRAALATAPPEAVVSAADLERRAATLRREILAGLSADPAVPPTLTRSAELQPASGAGDQGGPGQELSAGAAAYLRTYETFPSLPDSSWSWRRRSYVFLLQVCVSEKGRVDDVIVNRGARPDLDAFLSASLRTWRYRPWIVSGSARPFCHPLQITYSRG